MKNNHNFYHHIEQSLLQNYEQKLLSWNEKEFKGKTILKKIHAYQTLFQGLQKNSTVIIAVSASPDAFFIILALMAQGLTPVIPPSNVSFINFIKILQEQKIKGIVWQKPTLLKKFFGKILGKIFKINIIDVINTIDIIDIKHNPSVTIQEVLKTQTALISYSSGSTGKHKAVFRSHQVLLAQHLAIKAVFPPFQDQIDFPLFPNVLLHNMIVGVPSVMPTIEKFDLQKVNMKIICEQIQKEKISSMTGNVFYFTKMVQYLQQTPLKLPTVKAIGIGGSPVSEKLVFELKALFEKATIYVIYGSSEAEPIAVRNVDDSSYQWEKPIKGFCVGKVNESLEIKIEPIKQLDSELSIENTPKIMGEICVRGNHVATKDDEEWFRTGDFGYQDEKGILFLTGRKGNEKVISGVQHYLIEHLLLCTENIQQVAAIAKETNFDIYVVTNVITDCTKKEIQEVLYQYFDKNIIGEIFFKATLPTDHRHHSKILYQQLK